MTTTISFEQEFQNILQYFQEECQILQTQNANPRIVENIAVEAYGATMRLQELATISTPEPQTLIIQPWDKTVLKALETAIRQNPAGLQPIVDGEKIRIAFPQLTEEKRREFVKILHEKLENARVRTRKIRTDFLKEQKQREQSGEISEDDYFRHEKLIQKKIEECTEELQRRADAREKELMTV